MKIGLVIYGSLDTLSGGYLYDRKLVEYLRGQGDTVEIISLPWRNYAAHLTDNLWFNHVVATRTLRLLPLPEAISHHRGDCFATRRLRLGLAATYLKQNLDIVIQDELNHPSLLAANSGKHPYPIVSLIHHLRCSELRPKWQNDFYRVIEKKYLSSVDGFIFNSKTTEGVVNDLSSHGKPSIVAYPPTDRFGTQVTETEIIQRAQSPELRILFLGNVIYRKGLHTLIKAVESQRSKVQVDVVGSLNTEPKYAREMQNASEANHLASFFFHGALNDEPLIEKLRQAHVLVVPSSYEGFGIVYLEGMGFGLPAIGTTAGAAGEVIRDGETGFLIPPEDVNMLAERLSALASQRELLVRLSIHALRRYQGQPSWEQTAQAIREFLLELTKA